VIYLSITRNAKTGLPKEAVKVKIKPVFAIYNHKYMIAQNAKKSISNILANIKRF